MSNEYQQFYNAFATKDYKKIKNFIKNRIIYNIGLVWAASITANESVIEALEIIMLLIEAGVDLHFNHNLALMIAARDNHLDIVKYLVSAGANIHDQNNLALQRACWNNHLDIVKFLISAGADPIDYNILIYTVIYGNLEIIEYLIPIFQKKLNKMDHQIRINVVLIEACRYNKISIIKYLAQSGADPTAEENKSIIVASASGFLEIVRFLISIGADWRQCTKKHKKILKAEQIVQNYRMKKFKHISKNLIPVYYQPNFTGGKLAKKELSNFITKLRTVCLK